GRLDRQETLAIVGMGRFLVPGDVGSVERGWRRIDFARPYLLEALEVGRACRRDQGKARFGKRLLEPGKRHVVVPRPDIVLRISQRAIVMPGAIDVADRRLALAHGLFFLPVGATRQAG